jgi:hypothetical protein
MKLDKEFNLIAQNCVLKDRKDEQSLTIKSDDDHIYLVGSMNRKKNQNDQRFPFMIKLDKQLNLVDSVRGEQNNYQIYDFLIKDNKLITTGSTNLSDDCFIRVYDKQFNFLLETPLDNHYKQPFIIEDYGDTYLMGSIVTIDKGFAYSSVTKLDSDFNIIKETIYGTQFADSPSELLITEILYQLENMTLIGKIQIIHQMLVLQSLIIN